MENELVIGKYTLESLTNGMYASPCDLYREYIQNAVDSIDAAIADNLERQNYFEISINLDQDKKTLSIFDNGQGLSKNNAVSKLIDIGNSSKHRNQYRGFRGIGRLAGLGYCEELVFTTSYSGEDTKTIIHFNAKLLRDLLLIPSGENSSIFDVMNQIITLEESVEKQKSHYFEVKLIGVTSNVGLLDEDNVRDYLIQHSPIPYGKQFKWQKTIQEKVRIAGYVIPSYSLFLNGQKLYKPYTDSFVSDRAKRITDSIQDINVIPFSREGSLSAVLWYAQSSFYGTISENAIKGIRIRQGNILIGDRTTCNTFFKEERFNGWIIGELHVLDPELIVNSRRDDFEKNDAYYALVNCMKEWAISLSKDIRHISYERSLSREKKAVVEAQSFEDINDLCSEDMAYADEATESNYLDRSESILVAESDYIDKLAFLISQKKTHTKYRALNINPKLTIEQRKVLERVFDLIQQEYDSTEAEKFINIISRQF